jgi:hypothetical protein
LSEEQREVLWEFFGGNVRVRMYEKLVKPSEVNIGQMIEFLAIKGLDSDIEMRLGVSNMIVDSSGMLKTVSCLCDALWEACKIKLNN